MKNFITGAFFLSLIYSCFSAEPLPGRLTQNDLDTAVKSFWDKDVTEKKGLRACVGYLKKTCNRSEIDPHMQPALDIFNQQIEEQVGHLTVVARQNLAGVRYLTTPNDTIDVLNCKLSSSDIHIIRHLFVCALAKDCLS